MMPRNKLILNKFNFVINIQQSYIYLDVERELM